MCMYQAESRGCQHHGNMPCSWTGSKARGMVLVCWSGYVYYTYLGLQLGSTICL